MKAGQYIDSCWCASRTAITQTAAYCHLVGRLAMSLANTKRHRGIWYYFLICPSCNYLSWPQYLLALKQRQLYINFKCLCMCKIKWIVKIYICIFWQKRNSGKCMKLLKCSSVTLRRLGGMVMVRRTMAWKAIVYCTHISTDLLLPLLPAAVANK